MPNGSDFYELLQISSNAEPETIHRVYRLLAQRFHPDNQESGSEERFRALHEAYTVLSDPEQRARYDIHHASQRQQRWRLTAAPARIDTDYELEHIIRLTVLEVLLSQRRNEPNKPGVMFVDLEDLTGKPREHLEFTVWYLVQKKFVIRGDSSQLLITADGIDYLEEHYQAKQRQRRLTTAAATVNAAAQAS